LKQSICLFTFRSGPIKQPHESVKAVTFWGYSDKHTWLSSTPVPRTNLPLLFDAHLQPKAADWTIVDPVYQP